MYIDVFLSEEAAGRVLAAGPYFFALPMKLAMTFASWSTSPGTLPRVPACMLQDTWLGWLRACVWYPSSTWCACVRVVSARLCLQVGHSAREGRWPLSGVFSVCGVK